MAAFRGWSAQTDIVRTTCRRYLRLIRFLRISHHDSSDQFVTGLGPVALSHKHDCPGLQVQDHRQVAMPATDGDLAQMLEPDAAGPAAQRTFLNALQEMLFPLSYRSKTRATRARRSKSHLKAIGVAHK